MAAMFRNNVHLWTITDAFSRLQLQKTRSIPNFQQPVLRLRCLTQACPNLQKNPTVTDPKIASHHDHSSHKTANSNDASVITRRPLPAHTLGTKSKPRFAPRQQATLWWTDEEDRELWRLVKENKSTYDIYSGHFQYRTLGSVSSRIGFARMATKILERQQREGVRPEEVDIANSVAGGEKALPLRNVYWKLIKSQRAGRREIDKSDESILHFQWNADAVSRKGKWTLEEDKLLEKLVKQYIHIPEPTLWSSVAGASIGDDILLRNKTACRQRWRVLHFPPSGQTGRWTNEEERRLQEAIWVQFEGKYQVVVDVLIGKPATTENPLGKWRPELQQLPDQAGLPILKQGSRRLRAMNWMTIQEAVNSRSETDCRHHFYNVYHNANRNVWSEEEMARFKEGVDMFGKDIWKIAEHVGTRGPLQVNKLISFRRLQMKKKGKKEAATGRKVTIGAVSEH
ncbi:Myblike DNAbinding domain-containing protein [Linnemannia gamsii]|uniref:Myblike DNAbinding domain-containing protein n=1 Tax=Linnemannia gamsii TaxID=64522 RepID=A0ABQ7JUA7_9FUNG|nr:Myblike DNAbinding domain-containing protein [Linnemannia gamsii]